MGTSLSGSYETVITADRRLLTPNTSSGTVTSPPRRTLPSPTRTVGAGAACGAAAGAAPRLSAIVMVPGSGITPVIAAASRVSTTL